MTGESVGSAPRQPAARLLGISYKTLQYRLRKHELDREAFHESFARLPEEAD